MVLQSSAQRICLGCVIHSNLQPGKILSAHLCAIKALTFFTPCLNIAKYRGPCIGRPSATDCRKRITAAGDPLECTFSVGTCVQLSSFNHFCTANTSREGRTAGRHYIYSYLHQGIRL